ncbi:WXG100 family type VII secretion target [Crossiella sp. CA-258035]|uniref:WXG100 family type VII secretion target n=1 Tax=Crossiella sp. CA-258035 TaxID=2981138 RepID=UPI0024BC9951|nr:WXG100 family type VII secretion target [Crossiella sp. CA-258035]WHT18881.1 WXG100 family type VII secretion target [Crossiella sp. CA-258035]
MASKYGLDAEAMGKAAVDVEKIQAEVVGELRTLRSGLEPLQSAWKGTASTAFNKLLTDWGTETEKLNAALQAIGEQLKKSAGDYVAQEEEHAQSMSSISAGLDF